MPPSSLRPSSCLLQRRLPGVLLPLSFLRHPLCHRLRVPSFFRAQIVTRRNEVKDRTCGRLELIGFFIYRNIGLLYHGYLSLFFYIPLSDSIWFFPFVLLSIFNAIIIAIPTHRPSALNKYHSFPISGFYFHLPSPTIVQLTFRSRIALFLTPLSKNIPTLVTVHWHTYHNFHPDRNSIPRASGWPGNSSKGWSTLRRSMADSLRAARGSSGQWAGWKVAVVGR